MCDQTGKPTTRCVRSGGRHQLRVDVRERAGVDADLHERRLDARAVDAVARFGNPPRGQLLRALCPGMRRHELVVRRAVVAGVRQDVEAGRVRQPLQEQRIAPQVGRRALDQRAAAQRVSLLQVRQRLAERRVAIVAGWTDVGRADEIHEHVLVNERDAESLRGDGAGDGFDSVDLCGERAVVAQSNNRGSNRAEKLTSAVQTVRHAHFDVGRTFTSAWRG